MKLENWLIGNEKDSVKQGYIWNMIASVINASEAVVVLMVTTRMLGMNIAGIFTIAFTLANLLMCIGKFGVRAFQVSDTKYTYSFYQYYEFRLFSLLLMGIGLAFYLTYSYLFKGYSLQKVIIVSLVVALYAIEAYEDVYLAELQRHNRLDIGAKMFSIRWVVVLVLLCGCLVILKNSIVSLLIATITDAILMIILLCIIRKTIIPADRQKKTRNAQLFYKCLPLCITTALSIFIPNASKYAVDGVLSGAEQTCYGIISMPVFTIDVVSGVILQPTLFRLSQSWNDRDFKSFYGQTLKICQYIAIVALVVLIIGKLIGIPVLSLLYGVSLDDYTNEFIILLIGGIALGYVGVFNSILTIIRRQRQLMGSYIVTAIIAVLVIKPAVYEYGIIGAAASNLFIIIILLLIIGFVSLMLIKKEITKDERKKQK